MIKSYKLNRISAYIFDMFLVIMLSTMVASNYATNKYLYKYQDAYKEYSEYYESYNSVETLDEAKEFMNNIRKPLYKIQHYMIFNYFWYMLFLILYFVVFAYFTKGETLGKKIFKLKVVDNKTEKNPNIIQLFIRTMFSGSSLFFGFNLTVIINIAAIHFLSYKEYFIAYYIITVLGMVLEFIFYLVFFANKNNRTIDDILANTRVIEVK